MQQMEYWLKSFNYKSSWGWKKNVQMMFRRKMLTILLLLNINKITSGHQRVRRAPKWISLGKFNWFKNRSLNSISKWRMDEMNPDDRIKYFFSFCLCTLCFNLYPYQQLNSQKNIDHSDGIESGGKLGHLYILDVLSVRDDMIFNLK